MANEIKIIIGGDAQQFQKAATQTTTSLVGIGKAATSASTALNKTTPAVKQAGGALTDVNRVIQDLPFGFVAIQNNLTQLPESFKSLSRAAKESGQSIGGVLLKSLTGAGGIGFALSIVTSALAFATNGFGAWTRGLTSSGGAAKKAKEETEEFSKILQDAAQEAAKDATRVTTLFNALSSGTLSFEERKSALKELQSINKEFFGSLREEKGIIEGLEVAYQGYLDKVIQIGRAKAIETQLTKLFDKKLEIELAIDPKFLTQTNPLLQSVLARQQQQLQQLGGAVTEAERKAAFGLEKNNETLRKRIALQESIARLQQGLPVAQDKETKAAREQIRLIELQIAGLSSMQQSTGEFNIKQEKASAKEEDSLKRRIAALETLKSIVGLTIPQQIELAQLEIKLAERDAVKKGFTNEELQQQIEGIIENAFPVNTFEFDLKAKVNIKLDKSNVQKPDISAALGLDQINLSDLDAAMERIRNMAADSAQRKLSDLNLGEAFANSIINALQDGAAVVGEAFGNIFSGEGIGQAFAKAAEGVLSIVGSVLQDMGKQIIVASQAVQALKAALSKLFAFPGGGILAGLGLIAVGGLLKNIKFDLPKFQDGGITAGPASGFPAILHPNEAIIPLDKLPDIVGRLNGGGNNITLAPVVSFGYDRLYVGFKRTEERRRRLG